MDTINVIDRSVMRVGGHSFSEKKLLHKMAVREKLNGYEMMIKCDEG
jgi:hypothetical protein